MNAQVNVRMPDTLLESASMYAEKHGFANVQELIKETLREKVLDEPVMSKEELALVRALLRVSKAKNLFGTEQELFRKLKR